ncbi:MAG: IS21 family transposase [Agathobacter sp.]
MKKYKEILRYYHLGFSQRDIAQLMGVSRSVISRVEDAFKSSGLLWDDVKKLSNKEINELLFPKVESKSLYMDPDFESMVKELSAKGVTKKLLWEEYIEMAISIGKIPYQYSQFCQKMKNYLETNKATMHFAHSPGEKIEVDWAGKTIDITDHETGEIRKAYLFVGVLPFSQYAYAEVTGDMKEENWIMAHVHMFNFFGGTAPLLVCDNLKTGVICHPKHGEIVLNDSYNEMGEYYDLAIIPAAPRTPKGKPSVEGTVGKLTTDILARLRNETFYSVFDANQSVQTLLKEFNSRNFQKREGSRFEVYILEEKPKLRELPKDPYEYGIWKIATVQYNYHISADKMYYSVPYAMIHKKVNVRITKNMIEIYYEHSRICSHIRLKGKNGQYSTNPDHMPPNHKMASEWNAQRFINWAHKIGPSCETVIKRLLDSYRVEQQAYNGCRSILKFGDTYSPEKLERACEKALALIQVPRYKNIKLIIERNQEDELSEEKEIGNEGAILRGSSYYGGK